MNFIFRFLSISFLIFKFTFSTDHPCEGKHPWFCVKNPGSETYNVTLDCSVDNVTGDIAWWLWDPRLPDKVNTMTIQNCGHVNLYTGHDFSISDIEYVRGPLKIGYKRLELVNISYLFHQSDKDPYWKEFWLVEKGENDTLSRAEKSKYAKGPKQCLLKEAVFENIRTLLLSSSGFLPECTLENFKFLRMSKIYFSQTFPVNTHTIEIKYSNFKDMVHPFTLRKVNEVIISNNYFGQSDASKLFKIEAIKVILTENEIEILNNNSVSFTSKNIQITNNIFHHINGYAFNLISSITTDTKSNKRVSYNFSNNTIYSLAPSSLNIAPEKNGRTTFFEDLTIKNNSVSCDCPNIYWFSSMYYKKKDPLENRFYKQWIDKNNENKCLNIPNCSISHVLNNYRTLCEDDYDCLKLIEDKSANEFRKTEFISTDSVYMNSEISQNISNLLQSLLGRVEKIPLKEELLYMNTMNSCLLVITVIFCLILSYVVVGKCVKLDFVKVLILKYGPKNLRFRIFETGTEMENV